MIQADAQFVKDLKTKTEQAVQDTIVATRIIDGFKNPQQHGTHLKNYASFPLEWVACLAAWMIFIGCQVLYPSDQGNAGTLSVV